MKSMVLAIGMIAIGVLGWSVETVWNDFYEMTDSLAEAKATPLTSKDTTALKKAGVYYFALCNGVNSVAIDKKNKEDNSRKAMEYFKAAITLDKGNPMLETWKAAATLAHGGASKKLSRKIKFANEGIASFNTIPSKDRNNLNYLFMRIVSFSQVPKSFKNLTANIKKDAEKYMALYETLEEPKEEHILKETVKVLYAYAYYQSKDKEMAKEILLDVNENLFLQGQSHDTETADYYFTMKKKLKIKK